MFKVAMLGCGSISSAHVNGWKVQGDRAKMIAVADLLEDRRNARAADFGAKAYETADALLAAEKPDIVDICLPTALHLEYAVKAMRAGAHVLCEKPLCLSAEKAQELLAVEKETGKRMMVAHVVRFIPQYVYLRKAIEEQPFGKLLSLTMVRISGRRDLGLAWRDWNIHEELSGSSPFDLNIHDLDYMRSVLGEPTDLHADLYYHHDNPEHMFSIYRYGNTLVEIDTGWDMPRGGVYPWNCGYRAVFEGGVLEYTSRREPNLAWYIEEGIVRVPKTTDNADGTPSGVTEPLPDGYTAEILYFTDCLISGAPFTCCSLEDAIGSVRLTEETVAYAKARIKK